MLCVCSMVGGGASLVGKYDERGPLCCGRISPPTTTPPAPAMARTPNPPPAPLGFRRPAREPREQGGT